MIICRLQGGLGNQMLQYACARSLSLLTKKKLLLDLSFLNDRSIAGITLRHYELACFRADIQIATPKDIRRIVAPYGHTGNGFLQRKERKLYKHWRKISNQKIIAEKCAHIYDEDVFSDLDKWGYFMQGYFFSYRYFEQFRDVILNDFTPRELSGAANDYVAQIKSIPHTCSIHIRRGDYVTNQSANAFHGLCSLDYYRQAIALILEKQPETTFYCFSDDISWCKENLHDTGAKILFVNRHDDTRNFEDLVLMSHCSDNIIANSTFSWWGAWLNQNPSKQVIAPRNLFADKTISTVDIYPPEWILL
ncbi:MAG: alpha-1,2-fucosyltransferase [Bacteroidales bacterium]